MKFKSIILLLLLGSAVCLQAQYKMISEENDVATLATWMTGVFSSTEQAEQDTAIRDVYLRVIPIWETRKDGKWLYVEQAIASRLDNPYRQRIYHLYLDEEKNLISAIFTINDPPKYIGAQKGDSVFDGISPKDLIKRKGCDVTLTRTGKGHFVGSTYQKDCTSSLRGASYATTKVQVFENRLESWDRGYDSKDQQVWGAMKGSYIFLRKSMAEGKKQE